MKRREAFRILTIVVIFGVAGTILVHWIGSLGPVKDEGLDRHAELAHRMEPFEKHLREYVGILEKSSDQSSARRPKAIRGGVVTVRLGDVVFGERVLPAEYSISPVFLGLNGDLAAQSPSDVGTLVLINCEQRLFGEWLRNGSHAGNAYHAHCVLTAVDLKTATRLATTELDGPTPAAPNGRNGDTYGGNVNDADIAKWIAGLNHPR
jgi:hypothetical protein